MGPVAMALRGMRQRPLSTALTMFSVALGVALVVVVSLLEREAGRAFRGTAVGVEVLVAGNKGSRIDALLAALYHVGRAPGRVPLDFVEELRADDRVEYAVPLCVGDSYRGFPVVGTSAEMLTRFRPRPGVAFSVAGDGLGPWRAVVGATAARATGLRVGARFFPSHGGVAGDRTHEGEEFEVAGIAAATGTAHDKAIWVRAEDFLHLAGHHGMARDGGESDGVSAVLVKTKSGSPLEVEPLIAEINDGDTAQAIRPVQVVAELLELVGDVRRLLALTALLVVFVAAVSVTVALSNTMAERRGDLALLRALGASRARVSMTVLLEAALLCCGGALAGLLLGHGGAALASPWVEARAGVTLEAMRPFAGELWIVLALAGAGCLAGTIPAITAYRTDVARNL